MESRFKYLMMLLGLAVLFWVELFVLKTFNFWVEMTIATALLASVSGYINHRIDPAINYRLYYFQPKFILIGILSAGILYLVFFAGDLVSKNIFDFARAQVNLIYDNKTQADPIVIGLLLLLIIGPSEEIFWRGFLQDTLQLKFGDAPGWIIASLIYGGIHIVAWNFMLFMAALICGFYWGWIYKKYRSLQPCIVSHAVWDVTIFVLLPI
jgi:membrane protease YdiL (CAAX protease family)